MDSIIFDVDGTLWDSADSVAAAWNLAIKKFSSLDITLDREILGSVFGKTMTDIGDILFPSLSETEKDSLLSACCELENNYLKNHPENHLQKGNVPPHYLQLHKASHQLTYNKQHL